MAIFMDDENNTEIENVVHKPCPFCGNTKLKVMAENQFVGLVKKYGSAMLTLKCTVCKVEMPLYDVPNENYWMGVGMLVSKWNIRNGGNNDGN